MTAALVEALLPPTGLAVLALLAVLARWRVMGLVAMLGLVLLASDGAARVLLGSLAITPARQSGTPAAIVVLGGDAPGLLDPSRTIPGLETLARLRRAASLAHQTGLPILVSGAGSGEGVAAAMAASLADDFHQPVRWEEGRARNLWQSAAQVRAILADAAIERVYLVAEPWEMRLAAAVFRDAGLVVFPAALPHPDSLSFDSSALLVFAPAWLDCSIAIKQWIGLACQSIASCRSFMRAEG